jgi:hypothetical protein
MPTVNDSDNQVSALPGFDEVLFDDGLDLV